MKATTQLRPVPAHSSSRLARLQQVIVLLTVMWVLGWLYWARDASVAVMAAGALLIVFGYALVLAVEFVAVARINRGDPVPAASLSLLADAWWQEVRVAPQVFSWRQPFRWQALPDHAVPPAPGQTAAVLIHGFVCNRGFWLPWMQTLLQRNIPYSTVNLEPVFGSIDECVHLIDDAVRRAQALTGCAPVLVCHSMGGLAARAWLAAAPEAGARVGGVVTIGTPHHGTWLAGFSHVANGVQMRQRGEWLQALQAKESQHEPTGVYDRFICWYSNTDNIVFPASTATLAGADNRHVPGVAHVALAFHPMVMGKTIDMLAGGFLPGVKQPMDT